MKEIQETDLPIKIIKHISYTFVVVVKIPSKL